MGARSAAAWRPVLVPASKNQHSSESSILFKLILLLLVLWVPMAEVQSQTDPEPARIAGHVTDLAGRAVPGADVQMLCGSQTLETTADASGDFALLCADPQSSLRVAARGFATGTAPAKLGANAGMIQTIVLSPAVRVSEVTVTTRSSSPVGETAKTAYLLDSAELHEYPAVTLDESLRQHAGFELFRRASSRIANPTSEGVSLRGLGSTAASRTLVLEDGAPLNDPFGGWVHWNESPGATVESVSLVTGGGSDLYGSSALGGVIDIVPATTSPTRVEAYGSGGSEDTSHLQALATHGGRPGGVLLAGESLRTAGYRLVDPALAGPVDTPANVRSQSFRTELGRRDLPIRRLFVTGNLINEDRQNGTPIQVNATRLWRYLAGYDLPPDTGSRHLASGRARLFGSNEGYRQSFSAIGANRGTESLTRLQRVRTQELGASGDLTLRLGPAAAVFGADVRDIRGRDDETPILRGTPNGLQAVSARQRFFGGFAELLAAHGPYSAALSLRGDHASNLDIHQFARTAKTGSQSTSPDRTEDILSPRLGLVRTFGPRASLHASGFRAFRSPSLNELYRTGQVGQETTLANSALRSERATGWELGTQLATTSGKGQLQATYFWTVINRPVSAVLVAQTASTLTNRRENLGQIRSRGVELALRLLPTRPLSASFGYQYADATVRRFSAQPALVGKWIPQVPRHSATAQLRATNTRIGELTLAARASGRAFDDSSNRFVLARFFSLDLSGQRALTPKLDILFLIQNLTNQRAEVARTPILTLGTPVFVEAGVRLHLGGAPK